MAMKVVWTMRVLGAMGIVAGPAFAQGAQPAPAAKEKPVVVIETSVGDITVELDAAKAPISVENFLGYVKDGFYSGTIFHRVIAAVPELLRFLGEVVIAFGRLLRGKARFRRADFFLILQECGAQALPIVSLISFLVGLILPFVGAVQRRQFGAQIYVADLVGIAMAREMGAMMTGIVMAGRTGAAFAAQLGTMMVNEEIDALSTSGLPPMEFLVLPRMLALMLMVPLLCLYADLLGILGGALIGVTMLDLGIVPYFHETQAGLSLTTFLLGLIKAGVFFFLPSVPRKNSPFMPS